MRSLQAMKYHTMSAPEAWKKSMVLAVVEADLLVFTVALVSSGKPHELHFSSPRDVTIAESLVDISP